MPHPRRTSNMAGTSTPYAAGAAGRRARIISHGSTLGAQQHQEARPGRGAAAQDQLRLNGIAYERRGWDIHVVRALPQDRAEIWRARAKSFAVRPPAEWVLRVSVTLFQLMVTSGWWLAVSAR